MDEKLIITREATRKQLATEIYYTIDAIMDAAEAMENAPEDSTADALLVDIAGWAARIKALAGLAADNAFQIMQD